MRVVCVRRAPDDSQISIRAVAIARSLARTHTRTTLGVTGRAHDMRHRRANGSALTCTRSNVSAVAAVAAGESADDVRASKVTNRAALSGQIKTKRVRVCVCSIARVAGSASHANERRRRRRPQSGWQAHVR